jgi:mRNA-degrading endonuclease toxin of MazEF toxin-antitoxin module
LPSASLTLAAAVSWFVDGADGAPGLNGPQAPAAVVELDDREVLAGRVACDDIETLWADEVTRGLGALTPGAMARVEDGLRAAFDL